MILASVDLPAPFSPTRPRTRPAAIVKSTPRSALTAAKFCTSPRHSMIGGTAAGRGPAEIAGAPEASVPLVDLFANVAAGARQGPLAPGKPRPARGVVSMGRELLAGDLRVVREVSGVVLGQ